MKKTYLFLRIYNSRLFIPLSLFVMFLLAWNIVDVTNIFEYQRRDNISFYYFDKYNFMIFLNIIILFVAIIVHWYDFHRINRPIKGEIGLFIIAEAKNIKEYEIIKAKINDSLLKMFSANTEKIEYEIIFPTFMKMRRVTRKYKNIQKTEKIFKKKNSIFVMKVTNESKKWDDKNEEIVIEYCGINLKNHKDSNEKANFLRRKIYTQDKSDVRSIKLPLSELASGIKYTFAKNSSDIRNLDISEELFLELSYKNGRFANNSIEIKKRLKDDLIQVDYLNIFNGYYKYLDTDDEKMLGIIRNRLISVSKCSKKAYQYLIFLAVYKFLKNRDIEGATIDVIQCAKNYEDRKEWRILEAFFLLYKGHIDQGYKKFDDVFTKDNMETEYAYDFEELIKFTLEKEPEKTQLNLAIGIINQEIRNKNILAEKHYKEFLETKKTNIKVSVEKSINRRLNNIENKSA